MKSSTLSLCWHSVKMLLKQKRQERASLVSSKSFTSLSIKTQEKSGFQVPSHFWEKILGNFNWSFYYSTENTSLLKLILKFLPRKKYKNFHPRNIKLLLLSEISGSTAQIQWSCETRMSTAVCFTAPKSVTSGLCSRSLLGCDSARSSWCKFSWRNKYSQASRN